MLSPKNKYFPNGCTDEALDEVFSELLKSLHFKIDMQVLLFKYLRAYDIFENKNRRATSPKSDRIVALEYTFAAMKGVRRPFWDNIYAFDEMAFIPQVMPGQRTFGKTSTSLKNFCEKMKSKTYQVQYSALGDTVWVHCSTGDTVGRFSVKFGMDIHTDVQEQMAGKSQCLQCTHGQPTHADFKEFCDKAKDLWGVEIDQKQMDTSKLL